jgi:hypothetical protein
MLKQDVLFGFRNTLILRPELFAHSVFCVIAAHSTY